MVVLVGLLGNINLKVLQAVCLILFSCKGCAVPLTLKAEIMEVLAAFAQSPEIANILWDSAEVAQILATIATVS